MTRVPRKGGEGVPADTGSGGMALERRHTSGAGGAVRVKVRRQEGALADFFEVFHGLFEEFTVEFFDGSG